LKLLNLQRENPERNEALSQNKVEKKLRANIFVPKKAFTSDNLPLSFITSIGASFLF